VELAKAAEWRVGGFRKEIVGHCCGKGEFVDGGTNRGHDPLGTHGVEIFVCVDVASQVENLEAASNGGSGPSFVAEVRVSKRKLSKAWNAKERWKRELRPEDRVVRDVLVADDNRDIGVADEIVRMANRTRDVV
jgi:hypothetical protein